MYQNPHAMKIHGMASGSRTKQVDFAATFSPLSVMVVVKL
jgi:hypothetical protein